MLSFYSAYVKQKYFVTLHIPLLSLLVNLMRSYGIKVLIYLKKKTTDRTQSLTLKT